MTAKLDERFNQTSEALNQYKVDLRKSIGNIMSPLLWLPLKNSLDMITGAGSVTFSRASTATYIDRYGVLKYASIDEPRFEKEGLLIEGPSTNLLLYSEDFSNSVWYKVNGLTVTSNTTEVTAPDGSNNADIIDDTDNTQNQHVNQQFSIEDDDSIYTFSVFVKKKTSSICIIQINLDGGTNKYSSILVNLDNGDTTLRTDISNNEPYDYKVKYIKDGWYRISVSIQNNSTGNTSLMTIICPAVSDMSGDYDHEATGSIYVWGAQLEKLPFASSYIPTTDSAVTRAKDVCYVDYKNNCPHVEHEFTIVCDANTLGITQNQTVWSLTNTANYILRVVWEYQLEPSVWNGTTSSHASLYIDTTQLRRYVAVCGLDYIKFWVDDQFTDNTNCQKTELNLGNGVIHIGHEIDVMKWFLYGHISNFRIYDRVLTDEEVALL